MASNTDLVMEASRAIARKVHKLVAKELRQKAVDAGEWPMSGLLTVLNVGAGDIEVRFNAHQPEETARAIAMLKDMQTRGYAILVKQEDGSYARAVEIDAERALYIISGEPAPPIAETQPVETPKRRGRPRRSQPIAGSRAVGVARSAGG